MRLTVASLFCALLLLFDVLSGRSLAQNRSRAMERYPLELRVSGIQPLEIEAQVSDSTAFVPLVPLFDFIGIRSEVDRSGEAVRGFFRSPDSTYSIEQRERRATIDGRVLPVSQNDFFFRGDTPFVNIDFVRALFRIPISFNQHRLAIEVTKPDLLPGIAFQRHHARLLRAVALQPLLPDPEVIYPRDPYVTGPGRLVWHLNSSYVNSNAYSAIYSLDLGSKIIGGDLTLRLRGRDARGRSTEELRGQYRIPFPGNRTVQQVVLGSLTPFPYYFAEVIGGEVTNRPLARRRIFSRDIFQGRLGPRVDIETNDIEGSPLMVTDETGSYQLDMPVSYGLGTIQLRASDAFGQTQLITYRYNTPLSMVPPGTVEYSIVMGKQNTFVNTFASSNYLTWGVNSFLTIGTRLDYLDFQSSPNKFFPALTAASRLAPGLSLDALVSPALLSRFSLNWTISSRATLFATGTRFGYVTEVNPGATIEEFQVGGSVPLSGSERPLGLFFAGRISGFAEAQDQSLQLGVSKSFQGFSGNLSYTGTWRRDFTTEERMLQEEMFNVLLRIELPQRVSLTTNWTFDLKEQELATIQFVASKNIINNFFATLSYSRFPLVPVSSVAFQLQYRWPFATTSASVHRSMGVNSYGFLGYGAASFDLQHPSVNFENNASQLLFGGLDIRPFLDANENGKRDAGEQLVEGGRIWYSDAARSRRAIRLPRNNFTIRKLYPYDDYFVYLDPQSLDDPTLVPQASSYQVFAESNYDREIDIPVVRASSIRGRVDEMRNGTAVPLDGLRISLVRVATNQSRQLKTFSTGEFEFDLIAPGAYRIELDAAQLAELGLSADAATRDITIEPGGGDQGRIIDNVNFVLKSR